MTGNEITARCAAQRRQPRRFYVGLTQAQAVAYFVSLIGSLPVWPNGLPRPIAEVWARLWWGEQGSNGWFWYNWGNLHTLQCYPWCLVQGHRGPEWLRCFDSPQQGCAAMVLQHLRHLAHGPPAVVAEVENSVARHTPVPLYSRWVYLAWAGRTTSHRILGATDRVALTSVATGIDAFERAGTAAHEMAHLVAARFSRNELPGEERYIECLTKQFEQGLRRPGPIRLDGGACTRR